MDSIVQRNSAPGELKRFVDSLTNQQIQQFYNLMQQLSGSNFSSEKSFFSIDDFKADYIKYIDNTFSSKYKSSVVTTFNHLIKHFGNTFPIQDISVREAESFKAYLLKNSPKGVLVYLRNLKAAFNRAVEWEMIDSNPFLNIKIKKRQQEKPVVLEGNDLHRIITHIDNQTIRDLIFFAKNTGTRLNEAVSATWKNIDFNSKILTVGDEEFTTKNKRQRIIPLISELIDMLDRRYNDKNRSQNYVFHKSKDSCFTGSYISKRFKTAVRKADLSERIHFHSLRHTFGTELGLSGVPITVIRDLMGHSTIAVTEIYSHTNISSLKNAIEKLENSKNEGKFKLINFAS